MIFKRLSRVHRPSYYGEDETGLPQSSSTSHMKFSAKFMPSSSSTAVNSDSNQNIPPNSSNTTTKTSGNHNNHHHHLLLLQNHSRKARLEAHRLFGHGLFLTSSSPSSSNNNNSIPAIKKSTTTTNISTENASSATTNVDTNNATAIAKPAANPHVLSLKDPNVVSSTQINPNQNSLSDYQLHPPANSSINSTAAKHHFHNQLHHAQNASNSLNNPTSTSPTSTTSLNIATKPIVATSAHRTTFNSTSTTTTTTAALPPLPGSTGTSEKQHTDRSYSPSGSSLPQYYSSISAQQPLQSTLFNSAPSTITNNQQHNNNPANLDSLAYSRTMSLSSASHLTHAARRGHNSVSLDTSSMPPPPPTLPKDAAPAPDSLTRAFNEALRPYADRIEQLENQLSDLQSWLDVMSKERAEFYSWIDKRGLRPDVPPSIAKSMDACTADSAAKLNSQLDRKITIVNFDLHRLQDDLNDNIPVAHFANAMAKFLPDISRLACLSVDGPRYAFDLILKLGGNLNSHSGLADALSGSCGSTINNHSSTFGAVNSAGQGSEDSTEDTVAADLTARRNFYALLDSALADVVIRRFQSNEDWPVQREIKRIEKTAAYLRNFGIDLYFPETLEIMKRGEAGISSVIASANTTSAGSGSGSGSGSVTGAAINSTANPNANTRTMDYHNTYQALQSQAQPLASRHNDASLTNAQTSARYQQVADE